ncbi:hypothetical protein ALC53_09429 [Atta colombica]|uniref:Uncharacterized protein n=1 Tax=Atta colombica TaxID=520822 RepID=A0A195B7W4_9HYME|nr:hypothetical protein ALC53_09429 [Atta colombica]
MAAMLKSSAEYNRRAAIIEGLRAGRSATKIIRFFGYPRSTIYDIMTKGQSLRVLMDVVKPPDLNPLDYYVYSVVESITNKSRHPDVIKIRQTVRNLTVENLEMPSTQFVKRIRQTGSLLDKAIRLRARPVRSTENIVAVAQSVLKQLSTLTRHRSQNLNISRTSLRRILNKDLGK